MNILQTKIAVVDVQRQSQNLSEKSQNKSTKETQQHSVPQ